MNMFRSDGISSHSEHSGCPTSLTRPSAFPPSYFCPSVRGGGTFVVLLCMSRVTNAFGNIFLQFNVLEITRARGEQNPC